MNFQTDSENREQVGLASRSFDALKWNYFGAAVKVLSQFVLGIILARILGPEPFGLIAIIWIIIGLGNLIVDSGLGVVLIQKRIISSRDIRYVFSMQMIAGLTLTLMTTALAPWIASFFKISADVAALRWMSLMFVIQSFGQASSALLRRDLDHKRVQLIQVVTYLFAYLVFGLPLAFFGFGVWSLVIAQLMQCVSSSVAAYLSIRHSLLPTLRPGQPGLLRFSSKVMGSNLTSWGIANLDSAIIGRILGATNLGLYSRSMSLMASPMNATVSTLQGVLLPLFSRLQYRPKEVADTYLAVLCLMSAVLAPIFAVIAVIPQTAMLALYGPAWSSAAVLITPLALAMPVNAVLAIGGPLMLGLGHAGREAFSQAVGLAVMIVGVSASAKISLEAVAWVVLAVYCLRAFLVTQLAAVTANITAGKIIRALAGPLAMAILAALVSWQVEAWLANYHYRPIIRLPIIICICACVYVPSLLLGGPWLLCAEARVLLLKVRQHLPNYLGGTLSYWART